MLVWWAAFFFAGRILPAGPLALGCSCGALIPVLVSAVSRAPAFRRAALTAATGLIVLQHASIGHFVWFPAGSGGRSAPRTSEFPRPIAAIRAHVASICASGALNRTSRGLLPALLLADRSSLDPSLLDRWRRLGISHFLALSGLHLGILALPLYRIISILRLNGIIGESIAIFILSAYAAAAGVPLSLLRAVSFLIVVRAHLAAGRKVHRDEALLVGGFFVCLFAPDSMTDPGFMLSVAAAAGVLLVGLPLGVLWRSPGRGLAARFTGHVLTALGVSVSAMLFTIPLTTRFFGAAPLAGPLLSVLLAPLFTVLLYAGFLYAAGGYLLGRAAAAPINLLSRAVAGLPELIGERYPAAVIRGDFSEPLFLAGAVLLACALARGRPKRRAAAAGLLAIAVSFLSAPGPDPPPPGGGCDTIAPGVVASAGRDTLLIEGRLSRTRSASIARALARRGIRSVGLVIVEHGGCVSHGGISVLDAKIRIERVLVSPWLLECRVDAVVPIRALLVTLPSDSVARTGCVNIAVRGPRVMPGESCVVPRGDADLRIYTLDSRRR